MIHLYYKTSTSQQIKETTEVFEPCEHIDFSNIDSVKYDDIYLVEIDKTEKTLLLDIRTLLLSRSQSLIYFFINDSQSLMLFQLASLLGVKSIITQKQNIPKIISNIKKELSLYKKSQIEHSTFNNLADTHYFMTFNSNKLKFASKKIYDDFKCKNLNDIKSKICSQLDLDELLKDDTSKEGEFNFTSKQEIYKIKSETSSFNDDKFIYINSISKDEFKNITNLNFIKNRIYFIEILKEKILEKSISQKLFSIITIQIDNMSNLRDDWNEYEIEMAIRDLLLQVEIDIDSHTLLAQYDNGLYITLFEGLDFEATKLKASTIQAHISTYTKEQKIKPIIGLYAFDINDLELNNILKTISDISTEDISHKNIDTKKLHRIISIDDSLEDSRIIDMFLQAIFINDTPIKLLNIYKGLCINTTAKIVKKTEQEVYVSFEQLQGTAMYFEKETVLQSSNFTKDIVANVKYIDNKKKIVQLKNFKFVQGSANGRKYSRVTSSQRTPISITHDKGTINGVILDISINSIAIKTRVYERINSLKLSQITLNFTLPVKSSEDGYMKLALNAKVILTLCDDDFCKVVVTLLEDQANESVLMEYVYSRQKEIITELKKQATMLN